MSDTVKKAKSPIKEVTKDTNIAELVFDHKEAAEVLLDYGLHCVGCSLNAFDTVEQGAKIHGMAGDEIDEMITRLNEVIRTGE